MIVKINIENHTECSLITPGVQQRIILLCSTNEIAVIF